MTEKEKCEAGRLYDANFDQELLLERILCKDLCHEFNNLKPSNADERKHLIKKIIPNSKENIYIESDFWCDYGYNIFIGENFYSNHNLVILDGAKVTFGDNIFIGPNCSFYTAGHPFDIEQRNAGLEFAKPITVGNNVWFGGNVVVLPGVSIGDGAVIGAGSVVTKDIPKDVLAVGNPCKVVKRLTND